MTNNCVLRNYELKKNVLKKPIYNERIKVLKKFINNSKPSIDLGCGGFMPKILNVTHACDNGEKARELLKKENWKGEFKLVELSKKLPYSDKLFKKLTCSEVMEHLHSYKDIKNLFLEAERISNKWLFTTPSAFYDDPDHHFFFGPNELFEVIPFEREKFIIFRKGVYYYITNDKLNVAKLLKIPLTKFKENINK